MNFKIGDKVKKKPEYPGEGYVGIVTKITEYGICGVIISPTTSLYKTEQEMFKVGSSFGAKSHEFIEVSNKRFPNWL